MNVKVGKQELDELFARLNPPYNVVPEWFFDPLSDEELAEVNERLAGALPSDVSEISRLFSGLGHDVELLDPYASKSQEDEPDYSIVTLVNDVREWGGEELVSYKFVITMEGWSDIPDDDIVSFSGFNRDGMQDPSVILVGGMDHGEIYMDLSGVTGAPAGALLNIDYDYPKCYVRVISNSYADFWKKIVRSLTELTRGVE